MLVCKHPAIFFSLIIQVVLLTFSGNTHGLPAAAAGDTVKPVNKQRDKSLGAQAVSGGIHAKIYEVDKNNRILRPWTKINEKSETILQDVDRIRLECTSDVYPVQWLYFGHGVSLIFIIVLFLSQKIYFMFCEIS